MEKPFSAAFRQDNFAPEKQKSGQKKLCRFLDLINDYLPFSIRLSVV